MKQVALSFSGGKDSMFALYKLQQENIQVVSLLTTIWKESKETVAHGEKIEKMKEQAKKLRIPIDFVVTDFKTYTDDFLEKIEEVKGSKSIDTIAFGDIYLKGHRDWGEKLAQVAGIEAYYPLWTEKEKAIDLLYDYVRVGFKSKVTKVDDEKLPGELVGREVNEKFIEEIITYDVCPLGESGEYHTFVYDGPTFKK